MRKLAAKASSVMVIDDGDHFATPLIVHFELLSHLVTRGSYYLIQDTRLDRTCRAQLAYDDHLKRATESWEYCRKVVGKEGGPARAVRYLQCASPLYQGSFLPDRSMEGAVFTQHPGGWLKRIR